MRPGPPRTAADSVPSDDAELSDTEGAIDSDDSFIMEDSDDIEKLSDPERRPTQTPTPLNVLLHEVYASKFDVQVFEKAMREVVVVYMDRDRCGSALPGPSQAQPALLAHFSAQPAPFAAFPQAPRTTFCTRLHP